METSKTKKKRHPIRTLLRWTFRLVVVVVALAAIAMAVLLRDGLRNHFTTYPKQAQAWADLKKEFRPVSLDDGWNEYRGIIHSHSHLSHDSDVPFEEILKTMKEIPLDFILMSDHCDENIADFSKQWRGMHDGKLFVPGFEMADGFMPSFLPADTVLKKNEESHALAKQIGDKGGLLFFVHTEEPRPWDVPQLNGFEIYNIHSDFKDVDFKKLIPDIICNARSYHPQLMRTIFKRPTAKLQKWDELSITRKITAFGGNDCHQNTGIRAIYQETSEGENVQRILHVEDTSPDTLKDIPLNGFTKTLLRLVAGPLENGKTVFHFQLDPYLLMGQYCNTYVMARDLSEEAIKDSLKQGRAFVGFTLLEDCRSFVYFSQDAKGKAVMGETMALSPEVRLRAASPLPCRFRLIHDGVEKMTTPGGDREFEFQPKEPGKYRLEVELKLLDDWTPWIYTNPIEIK